MRYYELVVLRQPSLQSYAFGILAEALVGNLFKNTWMGNGGRVTEGVRQLTWWG